MSITIVSELFIWEIKLFYVFRNASFQYAFKRISSKIVSTLIAFCF